MDTPATQPSAEYNAGFQQTPPAVVKKSHGFFALLGKLFLFLFICTAFLGGGYYLGIKNATTIPPTPSPTLHTPTTPTPIPPSPTPVSGDTKTVKAGLSGSTAFIPYTIDVPAGWTDARETTIAAGIDKLTLTKNGYSITIYQAPMGGNDCIYTGDKPTTMAQRYTDFVNINGKSGQYRRSWNQSNGQSITYAVCQKAADDSYGTVTTFGLINVVSPNPANSGILTEIDGVLASLVKQ